MSKVVGAGCHREDRSDVDVEVDAELAGLGVGRVFSTVSYLLSSSHVQLRLNYAPVHIGYVVHIIYNPAKV